MKLYIKRGKLGIRGLQIMITNELKALSANKQIIYNSLLSPILYFIFYSVGIQSTFGNIEFNGQPVSFLSYSIIGIFAMSLFKDMYQCIYRMIIDKRWGLLSLKILNGVSPPLYIIGISTIPVIGVAVQTTVLYLVASFIGDIFSISRFLIIQLFLLICIAFWSSLLMCIALIVKNYKQRDFIMNVLMLPVMFSAPLFYSFENAPIWIQTLSNINPLTYQVNAMRTIAFGTVDIQPIIVVLLMSLVAYTLAVIYLYRSDFKNDEH